MTATKQPAKKLEPTTETPVPETEVEVKAEKATDLLTTREVAEALGTDPRTLRKFLRDDSTIENAGKGNRYEFRQGQIKDLKKRFAKWTPAQPKSKSTKADKGITEDEMRAALSENTVKELQDFAKKLEVTGYSSMKKADLVDAIIAANTA